MCQEIDSMCQEIDRLVREAVMDKMGELRISNCSLQSRKPWRCPDRDLEEIMILAEKAKILIKKVELQMLKTEKSVMDEEMAAIKGAVEALSQAGVLQL